jgi:hypothetical protein
MLCNEPEGYNLNNQEKLLMNNYIGYAYYNNNYSNNTDTLRGTTSTGCSTVFNTINNIPNGRAINCTKTLVYDWPTYAANGTITHIKMCSHKDATNDDWQNYLTCNNRVNIFSKKLDNFTGSYTFSKDNDYYYIHLANTNKIYKFNRYTWEQSKDITFSNVHSSIFKYNDFCFAMNNNGQIFKYDNTMAQIANVQRSSYVADKTLTPLDLVVGSCSLIVEGDKLYVPYRYDITKNNIKYRGCKVAILNVTDLSYIDEILIIEKDQSKYDISYAANGFSGILLCKMDKDKISVIFTDATNNSSYNCDTRAFNFTNNVVSNGKLLNYNCYSGNKITFQGSGQYNYTTNIYFYDSDFDFYICVNCPDDVNDATTKQLTISVPYGWLSTTKLDKPITKTSQNTMKITYQLTVDYLYPYCDTFYQKLKEKENTPS